MKAIKIGLISVLSFFAAGSFAAGLLEIGSATKAESVKKSDGPAITQYVTEDKPNYGRVGVFMGSIDSLGGQYDYNYNAGAGDVAEMQKVVNDLSIQGISYENVADLAIFRISYYKLSGDAEYNWEQKDAKECTGVCSEPSMTGSGWNAKAYWNVDKYFLPTSRANVYVGGGVENSSVDSSTFTKGDYVRSVDFSNRSYEFGVLVASDIDSNFAFTGGIFYVKGNQKFDYRSDFDMGFFKVEETGGVDVDYTGLKYQFGVTYNITPKVRADFGVEMFKANSLSASGTTQNSLDNNTTHWGDKVSGLDSTMYRLGVTYEF